MKKTICILLLFINISVFGQDSNLGVKLKGKITNSISNEVTIYKFDKSFELSIPVDNRGSFSSKFTIQDPGIYSIKQNKSYTTLFLKNGYDLTLSIDSKSFPTSLKFEGNGAVFNTYLKAKSKLDGDLVGDTKVYFVVPVEDFLKKIASDSTQLYDP